MKTKILLSILMLVISMMGYASEETNIPIEKMNYAMSHPGQEVVIDSVQSREYSPTMLHTRRTIERRIILYKDGKIIGPYTKTTKSNEYPSYHLIFWIIFGLICSFFWGYKRCLLCQFVSVLICIRAIQPNVHWWVPFLSFLAFGLVIVLGSLCRIKKQKTQ